MLFGALGILVFLFANSQISTFTPFPGYVALGPVFGTALLILAGSKSKLFSKILSIPPLTQLGDISYGWYVWHWPLIVFADIIYPASTTAKVYAALIALTVSSVSYRFIEQPIRTNPQIIGRRALRLTGICVIVPLLVSGAVLVGAKTGLGLKDNKLKSDDPSLADGLGCQATFKAFNSNRCVVMPTTLGADKSNSKRTVLLIGDSQAGAASDGVAAAANQLGMKFMVWYSNGCPVFPRPTDERKDCPDYQTHLVDLIKLSQPSVIVVANSSTLYTTRGPQRGGLTIRLESGGLAKNYQESVQSWTEGLRKILGSNLFRSTPMLLMQEVPSSDFTRVSLFRKTAQDSFVSKKYFYDRNHVIAEEKLYLENLQNVDILDPTDVICPNGQCRTVLGNQPIYADQYHLSPFGSGLLTVELKSRFIKLLNLG